MWWSRRRAAGISATTPSTSCPAKRSPSPSRRTTGNSGRRGGISSCATFIPHTHQGAPDRWPTWSFQLYSARNFQPWDERAEDARQVGYTQVEGFGGVYADPAAFRKRARQATASRCRPGISRSTCWRTISTARRRSPRRSASAFSSARTSPPTSARPTPPAGRLSASGWQGRREGQERRLRLRLAQP